MTDQPTKTCIAEGCNKPSYGRDYCARHSRLVSRGLPLDAPPPKQLTRAERFWSYVGPREPDACWLWLGARCLRTGHPRFHDGTRTSQAHRFSYELANGPIPKGLFLHHTCGVVSCVNPAHLVALTIGDLQAAVNIQRRGTASLRPPHPRTKLTEDDVREIRRLRAAHGYSYAVLSARFGVARTTVRKVLSRETWPDIKD